MIARGLIINILILLCRTASPKYYPLKILIFDQLRYNAMGTFPGGLASNHVPSGHVGC